VALLAVAVPGRPVKLQYTREQEHRWEPYGSAMLIRARAGVDDKGDVLDWELDIHSTPHGTRPGGEPGNLLSARYLEKPFVMPEPVNLGPPNYAADRNAIALYDFPGHRVLTHYITQMPLRVSSHRGLGAYGNVFAIESFLDELAARAGIDPVEFRLRHHEDPRARAVIEAAARAANWRTDAVCDGRRGMGIGYARYKGFGNYVAVVTEVEVARAVRVPRVWTALDFVRIVSPDGLRNQAEGGVVQATSWTLKEAVRFDRTRITSRTWDDYPILTFAEAPHVEAILIDRPDEPSVGVGEGMAGPTAAAIGNAVARALGVRVRDLPLTPERIVAAMT